MMYQTLISIDHYLFSLINQLSFRWFWLDALGVFLANYLQYFIGVVFLLFLLKFKKNWLMVLTALISAVVARFGIVEPLRWLRPRFRPFSAADVNLLVDRVNQFSFPSGHAAFFFALAMVVFCNNKKTGVWFFVAAILISIARVFVGVHWPSDILAGAAVGIIIGWLADKLFKKVFRKV